VKQREGGLHLSKEQFFAFDFLRPFGNKRPRSSGTTFAPKIRDDDGEYQSTDEYDRRIEETP
jgi:hypothetical protein